MLQMKTENNAREREMVTKKTSFSSKKPNFSYIYGSSGEFCVISELQRCSRR